MTNKSSVKIGPGRIRSVSKGDKAEMFETVGESFSGLSDQKQFR